MTTAACRAAFRQIEADLQDGLLINTPVDWTDALTRAEHLSDRYATEHGQRAIDLLHVVSLDKWQRKLAHAAGLKVKP